MREPMFEAFDRDDAEKVRWLNRRPVCDWCGERIQEESAIYFEEDNAWMCDACAEDKRRSIEE